MLRSSRRNCWIIIGCSIILVEVVMFFFEDVFNVFFSDDLLRKGIISFSVRKLFNNEHEESFEIVTALLMIKYTHKGLVFQIIHSLQFQSSTFILIGPPSPWQSPSLLLLLMLKLFSLRGSPCRH
jgi:hypothetical protein